MKKQLKKLITGFVTAWLLSTHVYAQNTDEKISKQEKHDVIEAVGKQLVDNYIFPEVAKKMADQLMNNFKKGQYKEINNAFKFKDALTADLVSVSHDKHIRVNFSPESIAEQQQAMTPGDEHKLLDQHIETNRHFVI